MRKVPPAGPCKRVPTTVRWVLAVMLVTTLVATHSHSPWSSLLRARNWRLPLGRALCLLLLGFPTLAKQGAGKRMGAGIQVKGCWAHNSGVSAIPESVANTPPLSTHVASPLHPQTSVLSPQVQTEPPLDPPCLPHSARAPKPRYLPPGDDRERVPCRCTGDEQLPAGLLPVLPAW